MKIIFEGQKQVEEAIKYCQKEEHVQQVVFSTYHHALTQICFTCNTVTTSMNEEDLK